MKKMETQNEKEKKVDHGIDLSIVGEAFLYLMGINSEPTSSGLKIKRESKEK